MTRGDKIRSMSDEQLASFMSRIIIGDISGLDYGLAFCDMCEKEKLPFDCEKDCMVHWLKEEGEVRV